MKKKLIAKVIKKWLSINPEADKDLVRYVKWQLSQKEVSMNALKAELKELDLRPGVAVIEMLFGCFQELRAKQEMSATPLRPEPLPGTYYKLIGNGWCLCIRQENGKNCEAFTKWEQKVLKAEKKAAQKRDELLKTFGKSMSVKFYENLHAGFGYDHKWGIKKPLRSDFTSKPWGNEEYLEALNEYLLDVDSDIHIFGGYWKDVSAYSDGTLHESETTVNERVTQEWTTNFEDRPWIEMDLRIKSKDSKYCPIWLAKARRDGTFVDWNIWKFIGKTKPLPTITYPTSMVEKYTSYKQGGRTYGKILKSHDVKLPTYIDSKGRVISYNPCFKQHAYNLNTQVGIDAYIRDYPTTRQNYIEPKDRKMVKFEDLAKTTLLGWAKEQKGCNMISLTPKSDDDVEYDTPGGDFCSMDPSEILERLEQVTDYQVYTEEV